MKLKTKNYIFKFSFHPFIKMGYISTGIHLYIDFVKTFSLLNFSIDFILFGFSLGIYRN